MLTSDDLDRVLSKEDSNWYDPLILANYPRVLKIEDNYHFSRALLQAIQSNCNLNQTKV